MNCGMDCIKYLIFIFNFIFALGGLAILVVGVLIKLNHSDMLAIFDDVPAQLSLPASVLIAVGAIIFIIAFFGCCGAARESHCMIVTFAVLLLTLLVVQVAIAAYTFIKMKDGSFEDTFNKQMKIKFDQYYDSSSSTGSNPAPAIVNSIQTLVSCCGYNSYQDLAYNPKNPHPGQLPYSCCGNQQTESCAVPDESHSEGCKSKVLPTIQKWMNNLGILAICIAAVELIGVIFSFCLANSIRNMERRGYKV